MRGKVKFLFTFSSKVEIAKEEGGWWSSERRMWGVGLGFYGSVNHGGLT
jgi:hypothetical protein